MIDENEFAQLLRSAMVVLPEEINGGYTPKLFFYDDSFKVIHFYDIEKQVSEKYPILGQFDMPINFAFSYTRNGLYLTGGLKVAGKDKK